MSEGIYVCKLSLNASTLSQNVMARDIGLSPILHSEFRINSVISPKVGVYSNYISLPYSDSLWQK
jgi:hypothetical protein